MSSLSLIIPSFKRYEILLKNINYINELEIPENLDIEFIIAANSCEKSNYEFVKNQNRFKLVFFEKYLPIGENMLRATKLANKEYVYLLGDDDVLAPFFFFAIQKYLYKNYSYIHFQKIDGYGDNLSSFDKLKFNTSNMSFYEKKLKIDEFILKYNLSLGFISSVIFKKNIIDYRLTLNNNYYGYDFLGPIYLNKNVSQTSCYISAPLLIQRHTFKRVYNSSWPYIYIVGARNFIDDIFKEYDGDYNKYSEVINDLYSFKRVIYNIVWHNSTKHDFKINRDFSSKLNGSLKIFFLVTKMTGTKVLFLIIRKIILLWR